MTMDCEAYIGNTVQRISCSNTSFKLNITCIGADDINALKTMQCHRFQDIENSYLRRSSFYAKYPLKEYCVLKMLQFIY